MKPVFDKVHRMNSNSKICYAREGRDEKKMNDEYVYMEGKTKEEDLLYSQACTKMNILGITPSRYNRCLCSSK